MTDTGRKLAVLFSGGGRTLVNLAEQVADGSLCDGASIVLALSSHPDAGGVERARGLGLPTECIDFREAGDDFSSRVWERVEAAGADWVVLAGWLRHLEIPAAWRGRVLNIHPSLLPAFGGKGFYGSRVHRAVLEAGRRESGCTVHFVDDEYDTGPIILQRVVPVWPEDSVDELADRVFQEELIAYPEAIRLCLSGDVQVDRRTGEVRLREA